MAVGAITPRHCAATVSKPPRRIPRESGRYLDDPAGRSRSPVMLATIVSTAAAAGSVRPCSPECPWRAQNHMLENLDSE